MQESLYDAMGCGVSLDRLDAYRRNDDDRSVITRYLWNAALCESLYPSLQSVEIVLRNSLHTALTATYHNGRWFDVSPGLLHPRQQAMVKDAEDKLHHEGKLATTGRIVAELNLGFWTSLFNVHYEQKGATDPRLWPRHLRTVFPGMPRSKRTRHAVVRTLVDIRLLRNRVFHHEPIWDLSALPERHTRLTEFVGWINPTYRDVCLLGDHFKETHLVGEQRLRRQLDAFLDTHTKSS